MTRPCCWMGFEGIISRTDVTAPIQVGQRWVELTHSWMNGYGKRPRCTDNKGTRVDFFLYLAAALSPSVNSFNEPATATAGTHDPPRAPEMAILSAEVRAYCRSLLDVSSE